jgi:hypothetical protein
MAVELSTLLVVLYTRLYSPASQLEPELHEPSEQDLPRDSLLHVVPPCSVAKVAVRVRVWVPSPHVGVQSLHSDQGPKMFS